MNQIGSSPPQIGVKIEKTFELPPPSHVIVLNVPSGFSSHWIESPPYFSGHTPPLACAMPAWKKPIAGDLGIQVFYLKIDGWWPTTSFQGRLGLSNVCFREKLSHQLPIDWKVNSFCNCEKTVQQKGDPRLPNFVNVQSNKRQQQMRHKTHDLLFPNNTKFISQLEPTFLRFLWPLITFDTNSRSYR